MSFEKFLLEDNYSPPDLKSDLNHESPTL